MNPTSSSKKDSYQRYVGQEGHIIKNCASFDEQNIAHTLCKMTVKTVQKSPSDVIDNYLTLDEPTSDQIVSCQDIAPSYYPDLTAPMIGKMPVYAVRNCEYNIPEIILTNKQQMMDRKFNCAQPQWYPKCI